MSLILALSLSDCLLALTSCTLTHSHTRTLLSDLLVLLFFFSYSCGFSFSCSFLWRFGAAASGSEYQCGHTIVRQSDCYSDATCPTLYSGAGGDRDRDCLSACVVAGGAGVYAPEAVWWQGELGFMHRKGEGGPVDYCEARKYYQLASDQVLYIDWLTALWTERVSTTFWPRPSLWPSLCLCP